MRKIKTFVLFCQKILYGRQITNSRSAIEQTQVFVRKGAETYPEAKNAKYANFCYENRHK